MVGMIYKYKLEVNDKTTLFIPEGSKIISAGAIGDDIFMWAVIKHTQSSVKRIINVKTTGYSFIEDDEKLEFIDTVIMDDGLVFHVFEELQ